MNQRKKNSKRSCNNLKRKEIDGFRIYSTHNENGVIVTTIFEPDMPYEEVKKELPKLHKYRKLNYNKKRNKYYLERGR